MIKREDGFSMVELIVTLAVFVFGIAAAVSLYAPLVNQFKQQSKISESSTEGIVGLEILRRDVQHGGYGLPWALPAGFNCGGGCGEAPSAPGSNDNDITNASPDNVPMAITADNLTSTYGGRFISNADYLVVKAVNVAMNATSQKWTNVQDALISLTPPGNPRIWDVSTENLVRTDNVIELSLGESSCQIPYRQLIVSGTSTFSATFDTIQGASAGSPWLPCFRGSRLIYGVDPATTPRMPFNRADYFVTKVDSDGVTNITPSRCAPNAGVLVKAVLNQDGTYTYYPLLDCVAGMQVIYGLAMNSPTTSPTVDTYSNVGTYSGSGGLRHANGIYVSSGAYGTATSVQQTLNDHTTGSISFRQSLKEVRIYILAHEGQKDLNFTYPASSITLASDLNVLAGLGYPYNLTSDLLHYRWKIYTLVIEPNNLL